jgi:endonuclease/exonuclease/phosphatase family metal-dependent hydrolase
VGLVEVDFGSYRVDRRNQAELIARALNHRFVYTSKYAAGSMVKKIPLMKQQGNAILTNRTILDRRFHFLRNGVKRLVIEVELPEVCLFLVHLSLKYRHRQYQLSDLLRMIENCDKPVIVAGDFNAFWGDRELELFLAASGLVSANKEGAFSYPSRYPIRELDFIFHSPQIRTIGFHLPQVTFSDHLPLLWDFDARHQATRRSKQREQAWS